ncbi:MAG: ABC transporter permease subunit [Sedimentisphaerales bacterium]|jgi:ABC-type transport system involved in multi-copper enzyme maturation permease subunit|nr:ABC transporter permease subunit [Sedimentisphaerales bacterium]HNY77490.1 ABC transporter permease subunit [Sedimentisphaerales bacterium]HOC62894.1 ABC transporter permease subunit [Sedimentisphaerales bacterium]HOH63620.1 ABC transporter permease subunit [Sedimentisphaerales bacterium]HPY50069.1 ABC transporter permease subunit [Sedimentisphaerales bacterium]
MMTSQTTRILEQINPLRLAGPLFDKELRVASRRRRFYAMRCVYICLFGIVVVYTWLLVARPGHKSTPLVWASRMSEVGKIVTAAIVWFQFIMAQLLTAILLSGAIATEIRHRTLDALLVTPISDVQIVTGKLVSGLLQLVLLLAVSLPLLAIVRVFGGVPWSFLVCGLCLTFATAVLVGALSLCLSVTNRQAHQVATNAVGVCMLFWFCTGMLIAVLVQTSRLSNSTATGILDLTSPYVVLFRQTRAMLLASGPGPVVFPWPVHCLVALGAAGGLLLLSVWRLRKAAAGAMVTASPEGQSAGAERPRRFSWLGRRAIRPVKGSPIVWKELCRPRVPRNRRGILSVVFLTIAIALVVGCVVVLIVVGHAPVASVCAGAASVFTLLFILDVTTSAAGTIPREKEARTWPILLATPLGNGEIVRGKAFGAIRRSWPLLAVVVILTLAAMLLAPEDGRHSESVLYRVGMSAVSLSATLVFLITLGLYVGTRVRTATMAVVATLGIYLGTQMLLGFLFLILAVPASHSSRFVIANRPFLLSIVSQVVPAMLYAGAGLLLARGAVVRLRRNVFS